MAAAIGNRVVEVVEALCVGNGIKVDASLRRVAAGSAAVTGCCDEVGSGADAGAGDGAASCRRGGGCGVCD